MLLLFYISYLLCDGNAGNNSLHINIFQSDFQFVAGLFQNVNLDSDIPIDRFQNRIRVIQAGAGITFPSVVAQGEGFYILYIVISIFR